MYKWLLFDADNTLFDFTKAEEKSLKATFELQKLSYSQKFVEVYKMINHAVWEAFERGELTAVEVKLLRFEKLLNEINVKGDASQFSQTYVQQLGNCPDLIPGAEELLASLAPRYKIGMITNGLKVVQRSRLALSPIQNYFDPIIISDEVGSKKPEPAIFDIAFSAMNNPAKEEVIIIGDSLSSDMLGGINYGIDTCWYNPHNKENNHNLPVTYEIKSLAELEGVVGE